MSTLTLRQRLFVAEYLIDGNATQAAIRAGYSPDTAKQIGHENLTKPDISAAVNVALDARVQRTQVMADAVITKAMAIVCFDVRTLFDEDGRLLPVSEMPKEAAQVLAGLDVTVEKSKDKDSDDYAVTTKIKLPDRNAAIATLLRHLIGMQVQMSGTVVHENHTPLPVDEITRKFREEQEKRTH